MEQIKKKRKTAKLFISGCLALMLGITTIIALWNVDNSTADGGGGGVTPNNIQITSASGGNNPAIILDGTLYAWGANSVGQLGLGDTTNRTTPTRVGEATNWKTVSTGGDSVTGFSLAINTDGELWAWGRNDYGQLGLGDTTNRNVPTRVGTASNWSTVAAGWSKTLAINTDGELWSWGGNNYGQLGLGDTTDRHVPTRVGTASNWSTIAGNGHSFAINTDGELYAWGRNNYGQLGLGDRVDRHILTRVGTASNWSTVAGNSHSFAINTDGELYAWGHNLYGELGLGFTSPNFPYSGATIPTRVGESNNWALILIGPVSSFALNTDGELYYWGYGGNNYLGLDDTTGLDSTVPNRVGSASNWSNVTAGSNYALAINSIGELWAWGNNNYGQLGLGDTTNRNTPTEVIIGSNVAAPTSLVNQITFSDPSATRVKYGGSYTFTATLATGYTTPIIQLTTAGKAIAKIALTSVNKNVYTYTVYDVMGNITASHFTRAVSRIN